VTEGATGPVSSWLHYPRTGCPEKTLVRRADTSHSCARCALLIASYCDLGNFREGHLLVCADDRIGDNTMLRNYVNKQPDPCVTIGSENPAHTVPREIVAIGAVIHKLDAEAIASRQRVRSLTPALLKEVRASASIGGGGRNGRTGGEAGRRKLAGETAGTPRGTRKQSRCYARRGSPI
jgi:hypothetical protein